MHGVDPDDKGVYPVDKDNGFDNDLADLAYKMNEDGFGDAPGILKDKGIKGIYTPGYYDLIYR